MVATQKYSSNKLDFINKYCQQDSEKKPSLKLKKIIFSKALSLVIGLLLSILMFPIYSEIIKQIHQSANRSTEELIKEALIELELEQQNNAK